MTTAEIQQSNELPPPAYEDDSSNIVVPAEKHEEEDEIDYSVTDKLINDSSYYDNLSSSEPLMTTAAQENKFELSLLDVVQKPDVCCPALMFGPCIFARSNRVLRREQDADPELIGKSWFDYLNVDCAAYSLISLMSHSVGNLAWRSLRRRSIRQRYGIEGNICKDVAETLFCTSCTLAQEDYEVKNREQEIYNMNYKQDQQKLVNENLV